MDEAEREAKQKELEEAEREAKQKELEEALARRAELHDVLLEADREIHRLAEGLGRPSGVGTQYAIRLEPDAKPMILAGRDMWSYRAQAAKLEHFLDFFPKGTVMQRTCTYGKWEEAVPPVLED